MCDASFGMKMISDWLIQQQQEFWNALYGQAFFLAENVILKIAFFSHFFEFLSIFTTVFIFGINNKFPLYIPIGLHTFAWVCCCCLVLEVLCSIEKEKKHTQTNNVAFYQERLHFSALFL